MKTIKIKTNSIHAKIVDHLKIYPQDLNTCSYVTAIIGYVLWTLLKVILFCVVTAFFGLLLVDSILGLWFSYMAGHWILSEWAVIGISSIGVILAIIAIAAIAIALFGDKGIVRRLSGTPSGEIFTAWHEKVCRKIEFE